MDHQAFAQMLGNYGEFVGAIAVVITLGYLAVQIRQNTAAIDHSRSVESARVFIARTEQRMDIGRLIAESEELAEILVKTDSNTGVTDMNAVAGLTPTEQRRLFALQRIQALNAESVIFQHEIGLVDDELYENTRVFMGRSADVWTRMNVLSDFRESFVRAVQDAKLEYGS